MLNEFLKETIINILDEHEIDCKKIDENSNFISDLNFSSLMFAQVFMILMNFTNKNPFDDGVDLSKILTIKDMSAAFGI